MTQLSEHLALALVEEGARLSPLDRAVRLYAALAGIGVGEAAQAAVDERDKSLLAARRARFGSRAEFVARCPECELQVESELDLDALLATRGDPDETVRAPTSREVSEAARAGDASALLDMCRCDDALDLAEVEERLEKAHPLLDIAIALECPDCAHRFEERFDIARYLWIELERETGTVLDEVHILARSYGWSEEQILALGPRRRRAYIDRIAA